MGERSDESTMRKRPRAARLASALFLISAMVLAFVYGAAVGRYRLFPYQVFELAAEGYRELRARMDPKLPWFYRHVQDQESAVGNHPCGCRASTACQAYCRTSVSFSAGNSLSCKRFLPKNGIVGMKRGW